MADLRIVDAPVLLQESITDDVKMPTGGLGNYAIRLGDLVWYVVAKEQLASKDYVDNSSKGVKDELDNHITDKDNPHQVTKEQVGLGNVDNTADVDKPVSNAVNSAIITATNDMATKAYVNQKDNLKADITYVSQINDGLDSIDTMLAISNPRNGQRVYVKSYHAGLGKGGGYFTYDSTKADINDGGAVINGWVREKKEGTLSEYGGVGSGSDDKDELLAAIESNYKVHIDTDKSSLEQIKIEKPIHLIGDGQATLSQPTKNQHLIYSGLSVYDAEYGKTSVLNQVYENLNLGSMPLSDSDDFAAIAYRSSARGMSRFNRFKDVENGIAFSSSSGAGYDNTSLCDYMVGAKRFSILNASAYAKIIGLTSHNNGVNTYSSFGGTNNGGFGVGLRLIGDSKGSLVVGCNLRDKSIGVSQQLGGSYNVVSATYFGNTGGYAVSTSSGSEGSVVGNIYSGVIVRDSDTGGYRLTNSALCRIDGLIQGIKHPDKADTAIVSLKTVQGAGVKSHRIVYKNGTGTVPAKGTVISQNGITATLVNVRDTNSGSYVIRSEGSELPKEGEMLVTQLSSPSLSKGALTGINADLEGFYPAEGRHRIDSTISDTNSTAIYLDTDCNLVTAITSRNRNTPASVQGDFNIIDLIVDDSAVPTSFKLYGSNNIIRIVGNSLNTTDTIIRLYGNNNTVIASCKNRVMVFGDKNNVDVNCSSLVIEGKDNKFSGIANSLYLQPTAAGNDLSGLKGTTESKTITGTTTPLGELDVGHGLILPVSKVQATYIGEGLKHVTVVNKNVNSKTVRLKLYNADGTPLASTQVSIDLSLSI